MKKIVITGPESSGKSILCKELADHFQSTYIPEYARIYLEEHGADYDIEIFEQLVSAHLKFQNDYIKNLSNKLVFLDTDLINYRVWSRIVFKTVLPVIDRKISKEKDHLYLLMSPDLPWEEDPLREHPYDREYIFDLHLEEIEKRNRPYKIINGKGELRFSKAVEAVGELIV